MTGSDAPFGDKFKKAYGLAVEEINAKGGVNGRKLEIVLEDHQAKNALAATVTEKLITQEKVLVMTGGRASGQAVEIASVCQRLKTPYLVDHPSADIITSKGFEWVFRNNPTGSIYPQAFNRFITEVPGAMPKSAAVIYDNTVFGKTIANSAMTFLKSKGVPIVADEAYPVNTLDFKPLMTKVKAASPDYFLMVAVSTTDAILLLLGAFGQDRRRQDAGLERIYGIFPRLRERRGQVAGTLSGGEQQMVAIGRGLMAGPRILMLDEPSLGLAPIVVEEMFQVIEEINRGGVTVLLVEQNTEHALAIAHRGFVLESGRLVLAGTGRELLANERVRQAYLGM